MAVSRDYFISENGFEQSMKNTVEPYLRKIATDGFFDALPENRQLQFLC